MTQTSTTEEAVLRHRLHRMEDHLTAVVDEEPFDEVRPLLAPRVTHRRPGQLVAAVLVVVVGAAGALGLAVVLDRPAEVSTADVPSEADGAGPTPPTVAGQGPIAGVEPTAAMVDAGAVFGLVVVESATYPGGGWWASYAVGGGAPVTVEVTTGTAPEPRDGRALGQVLLSRSTEISADGVDAAFYRSDPVSTDVSGVRGDQFLTLKTSLSLGLDQGEAVGAFEEVLTVVLGG